MNLEIWHCTFIWKKLTLILDLSYLISSASDLKPNEPFLICRTLLNCKIMQLIRKCHVSKRTNQDSLPSTFKEKLSALTMSDTCWPLCWKSMNSKKNKGKWKNSHEKVKDFERKGEKSGKSYENVRWFTFSLWWSARVQLGKWLPKQNWT